jgi:hypothetical protein
MKGETRPPPPPLCKALTPAVSIVFAGYQLSHPHLKSRFICDLIEATRGTECEGRGKQIDLRTLRRWVWRAFGIRSVWPAAYNLMRSTRLWGHYFWVMLHHASLGYKKSRRQAHLRLLYSTAQVLPCSKCGRHFMQLLRRRPFPKDDLNPSPNRRLNFVHYVVRLHAAVNQRVHRRGAEDDYPTPETDENPRSYLKRLGLLTVRSRAETLRRWRKKK